MDMKTTTESNADRLNTTVSGRLHKFVSGVASLPAIRAIAEDARDFLQSKDEGKMRAAALGHPDWENICTACGAVEISHEEMTCNGCTIKRHMSR